MTDAKTTTDTLRRSAVRGPRRPDEEIARLGTEIYERDIKAQVEENHDGEVVAIDVDSGEWAIAKDLIAATDRLREKRPDANDVFCERVGDHPVYMFGVGLLRRKSYRLEGAA